jgi:hypothetical protein
MAPPLSPDTLVRILKAEGLTVREYRDWRTHRRPATAGAFSPIHGVMNHHTVTGPGADVVALCYRGHANLPGPLCQGVITKDGTVWLVSAGRANHAGLGDGDVLKAVKYEEYGAVPPTDNQANVDGNAHFYGFEHENKGDGKDPWPARQYLAIVKANAAICRHYQWTEKSCIGHLEWQPGKVDPRGFTMTKLRADIKACLAKPAGKWGGVVKTVTLTIAQRVAALEAAVKALRAQK